MTFFDLFQIFKSELCFPKIWSLKSKKDLAGTFRFQIDYMFVLSVLFWDYRGFLFF